MKDINTYNHTFTQQVKPAYSKTAGKPYSGVQMTFQEVKERTNQLSH